jgi:hypothetical protein
MFDYHKSNDSEGAARIREDIVSNNTINQTLTKVSTLRDRFTTTETNNLEQKISVYRMISNFARCLTLTLLSTK